MEGVSEHVSDPMEITLSGEVADPSEITGSFSSEGDFEEQTSVDTVKTDEFPGLPEALAADTELRELMEKLKILTERVELAHAINSSTKSPADVYGDYCEAT